MRFPMQTLKPLGDQGALEADPAPKDGLTSVSLLVKSFFLGLEKQCKPMEEKYLINDINMVCVTTVKVVGLDFYLRFAYQLSSCRFVD